MTKSKKSRKRFTLVELLVVVAIIGVVMALVLPAFNRMISGNKVDQWTGNLKLAMEQARSLAASRRAPAGVVIVNNGTDYPKKTAYRLAQKAKNGANREWQWVPDSSWKVMEGAVLVAANTGTTEPDVPEKDKSTTISLTDFDKSTTFNFPLGAGVKFGSNGMLYDNSSTPVAVDQMNFIVAEGELDSSGNIIYTAPNSASKTDNFLKLKLNGLTGRVEYVK